MKSERKRKKVVEMDSREVGVTLLQVFFFFSSV